MLSGAGAPAGVSTGGLRGVAANDLLLGGAEQIQMLLGQLGVSTRAVTRGALGTTRAMLSHLVSHRGAGQDGPFPGGGQPVPRPHVLLPSVPRELRGGGVRPRQGLQDEARASPVCLCPRLLQPAPQAAGLWLRWLHLPG